MVEPEAGLTRGEDGLLRCSWGASTPDYLAYHDEEWGKPVRGETALYERFCLEAFQSGLAWITILRKREGFRRAFAGFDPEKVARFTEQDEARLLTDASIVRNRAKIAVTVRNARATLAMRDTVEGGLDPLVWSFAPDPGRPAPRSGEVAAVTAESTALAKALKKNGFSFVGPTTAYAAMQACGLVNDHLAGCHTR